MDQVTDRYVKVTVNLHDLAPDGHLTITRPDGTIAHVYLV